ALIGEVHGAIERARHGGSPESSLVRDHEGLQRFEAELLHAEVVDRPLGNGERRTPRGLRQHDPGGAPTRRAESARRPQSYGGATCPARTEPSIARPCSGIAKSRWRNCEMIVSPDSLSS